MKYCFWLFVLFFIPKTLFALSCSSESMPEFARDMNSVAQGIVSSELTPAVKRQKLEDLVLARANLPMISRFLMGRFFTKASESQRHDFMEHASRHVVRVYAGFLSNGIEGELLVVKSKCYDKENGVVGIRVSRGNDFYTLEYRLMIVGGEYKINDVMINGLSTLISMGESFDSFISEYSLDEKIASLEQENLNS